MGPQFGNAFWDPAQFLRLPRGGRVQETCSWSSVLSAIRAVIMGLFTVVLVFAFCLFPRIGSQNTPEHQTNLEKRLLFAPLVHADVLSSLATKLNLNSPKPSPSPLSPPRRGLISPSEKCCAFVVCLCKQGLCENLVNPSRWLRRLYCHEH